MKYIADLKIGDTVWEVIGLNIVKTTILSLDCNEIYANKHVFDKDTDPNISDRAIGKYNNILCLTLEDACNLAKVNAFEKIKEHIKTINEKGKAIEAIGLRINELNDFKYE